MDYREKCKVKKENRANIRIDKTKVFGNKCAIIGKDKLLEWDIMNRIVEKYNIPCTK